MKEYKLSQPKIIADNNWFNIVFNRPDIQKESYEQRFYEDRNKTTQKTREKTTQKTREKTREKIIRLITENSHITIEELAEKTEVSIKGVEWQIKQLKKEGLIKRIGSDKGGYWEGKEVKKKCAQFPCFQA